MLVMRFVRTGRRNKAHFRIVVQEHTTTPKGRHVAIVGSYDPHHKTAVLRADDIALWLSRGAQPSDTVHNLLIKKGIIRAEKVAVTNKKMKKAAANAATKNAQTQKETSETPAQHVAA